MFSHLRLVFSLKIWQFDSEALEEAVKLSYTHDTLKTKTVFPTGDFFSLRDFRQFKVFSQSYVTSLTSALGTFTGIMLTAAGALKIMFQ